MYMLLIVASISDVIQLTQVNVLSEEFSQELIQVTIVLYCTYVQCSGL